MLVVHVLYFNYVHKLKLSFSPKMETYLSITQLIYQSYKGTRAFGVQEFTGPTP